MKEVKFLDGEYVFATARDFETASLLWSRKKWTVQVQDKQYEPLDFRGREAIENMFGQLIRPNYGNIEGKFLDEEEQDMLSDIPCF